MNNDIDIIEQIRLLSNLSTLIPLIFYLNRYRHSPLQNHFIGSLIVFSCGVELVTFFGFVRSPIIYGIYNIFEFTFITLFFYQLVYKKRSKIIIWVSVFIYLTVMIYSISKHGPDRFYSGLISTASFIVIIHTLVYSFNIPTMTIDRYFDRNFYGNLIFNATMFCYFFILFTMTFLNDRIVALKDESTFRAFWSIHNVCNILKNVCFGIAFHFTGKRAAYMTVEQLERIAEKLETDK